MRDLITGTCLSLTLFAAPLAASDLVLLELYTSQGCNACPPADEYLRELDKREDVLAFSFHVDYWDYIGWADTFALPSNGFRQKSYARAFGERMVYTPQMVVHGKTAVVGHKKDQIESLIEDVTKTVASVEITASRSDGMLDIFLEPVSAPVGEAELYIIRYLPEAVVQIGRGENAGRRATYSNVVMAWHLAEVWDGDTTAEFHLPVMSDLSIAVLVQQRGQGQVLAAARVE